MRPVLQETDRDRYSPGSAASSFPERVPWTSVEDHLRSEWSDGQHFGIFAPTGSGKTVLASQGLLKLRPRVLTIDPKGDDNISWAKRSGFKVMPHRPEPAAQRYWGKDPYPERYYWVNPPLQQAGPNLYEALRFAWSTSRKGDAWTVYVDELKLISDPVRKHGLGLEPHVIRLLRYGRGRGVTFVGATQSPRYITSDIYDQPSWHAIGYTSDRRTIDRYGEISGFDMDVARDVIPSLGEHEFWFLGPKRWQVVSEYPLRARPKKARVPRN